MSDAKKPAEVKKPPPKMDEDELEAENKKPFRALDEGDIALLKTYVSPRPWATPAARSPASRVFRTHPYGVGPPHPSPAELPPSIS